ncbi:hypothetical protein KC327_g6700 [Hortaea werneckii]|nr:hypothetical protein KC358_g6536 [Hortaea werneckii]KAI6837109.1 hypothetical protein KC350_g6133 [Hortaea werneckii]KAI6932203.1 hypothetical protein KC348_g7059 [Hortaea werneckii]KAI6936222.1 hypothetical protein KC341_g6390 [Hortaea werneckii]KAI6971120.1 hypothetical protein KC321_g6947 [Hortaea werneckii]
MTELQEPANQPSLLALPAELLLHIFTYLSPLDLGSAAQTCHGLLCHAYDDALWQPLVSSNIHQPLSSPVPCHTFRDLYLSHHPHWFLPRYRVWFADSQPSGKLLIARYNSAKGSIEAHAVVAQRGHHTLDFWDKDREVIIHSFNPHVSLSLHQPVLKLDVDSPRTSDQPQNNPSDRGYAPPSRYNKEVLMDTFADAGLYSSFMLCRNLPKAAMTEQTRLWPPLRLPAKSRTRNDSGSGFLSSGHRPSRLSEVSQHHFRLRKWVEYTGRRSTPTLLPFNSPNGLSAALGLNNGPSPGSPGSPPAFFAAGLPSTERGGLSIRMPEDITTYATLPPESYMPRPGKEWQGIWCGDYSGHGCEFLLITQPDEKDTRPLPEGMDWLRGWFGEAAGNGRQRRESGGSDEGSESSWVSARESPSQEEGDGTSHSSRPTVRRLRNEDPRDVAARQIAALAHRAEAEATDEERAAALLFAEGLLQPHEVLDGFTEGEASPSASSSSAAQAVPSSSRAVEAPTDEFTDYNDAPSGRLEAIKLTGDPNIPRCEYTFIAPDIGHKGFVRVCDEEMFKGARVVRSAGHIAGRGFISDQYTPSQLIMASAGSEVNTSLPQLAINTLNSMRQDGIALFCTLHPASSEKAERCLNVLRTSAREYYRTPRANCTAWSYFTPLQSKKPKSINSHPIICGLEIYTTKAALQSQVDDPVYFQRYHEIVRQENLYAKPEELVAWYPAGGSLARDSSACGNEDGMLVSVTRMTARKSFDDLMRILRPFVDSVTETEPEVLTYAIFRRPKAPKELLLIVRYQNRKALKGHLEAPQHTDVVENLSKALESDITQSTTLWKEVPDSFVNNGIEYGKSTRASTKL